MSYVTPKHVVAIKDHIFLYVATGKIVLNIVCGYKLTTWWVNGWHCVQFPKVLWPLYFIQEIYSELLTVTQTGVFVLYFSRMKRITSLPLHCTVITVQWMILDYMIYPCYFVWDWSWPWDYILLCWHLINDKPTLNKYIIRLYLFTNCSFEFSFLIFQDWLIT